MPAAKIAAEFGDGSLSARYTLAVANSLMAAIVGTLTFGIGAGLLGALVMFALPFTPFLRKEILAWVAENPFGALLGAFLLFWIVGTIIWGLAFAFGIALILAPVMLSIVVGLTFVKPSTGDGH